MSGLVERLDAIADWLEKEFGPAAVSTATCREASVEIRQLQFDLKVAKEREDIDNTESRLANARIKDLEACLDMAVSELGAWIKSPGSTPTLGDFAGLDKIETILNRNPQHAEWGAHEFNQCCSFHRDGGDICAGCCEPTPVSDKPKLPKVDAESFRCGYLAAVDEWADESAHIKDISEGMEDALSARQWADDNPASQLTREAQEMGLYDTPAARRQPMERK